MIYDKEERKPQIWLSGAHFVNDIYTGFLNPLMPFIAEKINISMTIATLILSCSHIFSSLLQPVFGFFADKMRKRALIFWGVILTSLFISLVPATENITKMIIFIIAGSIGSSLFHPQALGFVIKFSKRDTVRNMGIFIACGTLGYSLGPLISSSVAQYFGISKMPYLSVFGIIWAFTMFACVPKSSDKKSEIPQINLKKAVTDIVSNRKLNILNLIAMFKSLITTSCSILLPFMWKAAGYSKFQIGLALFGFLLCGGAGSLLSPKLEKKIGTANVFYISLLATFPMTLLYLMFAKSLPVLSFIIFALTGFVTMFATPVTMSMAQRIMPEYKSIIGGFINGFSWGVVAIAMSLIGYIAQSTNIPAVLAVISFIPALSFPLVSYLFKDQKI